ncbi:MAG: magnesium chelatase [Candidatus Nealsonbacteria bacterium CG08_land_8_20_14_0_20_38_20]|uniref:Magnesium chelatase n=1 Tax=Candidatus Nealsonbacteria bacterium CG08_land_8_20_14_0_20_38_20 TaxID=1974705 RepID=A0A2H0YL03_9BACT|nr:MAG: magnesium chelatase [Candidatus Nealsonbacteria bacterium CG08_land_8_20_14_0_20_38_20]
MLSKVYSAAMIGLEAKIIEVEIDTSYGLRRFEIVGLPDKAVQESRERVGAAIESSGFQSPHSQPVRVLVSLAPADLKKEGSLYDLPIAIAYLLAEKKISFSPAKKLFLGELSLQGVLRPIKGALSFALFALKKGFSELILPKENSLEAGLIGEKELKIIGARDLREVVAHLEGKKEILAQKTNPNDFLKNQNYPLDLKYIKGQEYGKRVLEIAAAGGHSLLMTGPPGTGKTLLAKGIISILPPLSFEESLEVTRIYSLAGLLPKNKPLINQRPFRSPHHTSSEGALIGGGNPPRPGEITLAHRGVLFLDEFPEFHRNVLEALRQPIEEGEITILRTRHSLTFPARFALVAASNPCPCGYFGNPEIKCTCSNSQISMYRRKLSGPLMDRLDLFITVPQIKYEKLAESDEENQTPKIREEVLKARELQKERYKDEKFLTNSEIDISKIKKYCQIDGKSQGLLKKFVDSGRLSARGYHRVLKTARTIADLENSDNILFDHLSEALSYRLRDDNLS